MQAIILAGGYGTRLRSVVSDVPKPMAPIRCKPFLAYLLDRLVSHGFTKVVLAVGYQYQMIQDYFGERYQGIQLEYSIETDLLGTGGAIKKAFVYLDQHAFFVLNGDTFFDIDYSLMLEKQKLNDSALVLALKNTTDVSRYGSVLVEDERIVAFHEKGCLGPGLINAGIYLLTNDWVNYIEPSVSAAFSFEKDFLYPLVNKIKPHALIADGYFIDIGVPDDYARAQLELSAIS